MKYPCNGIPALIARPACLPLAISVILTSTAFAAQEVEVLEVRGQHQSNAASLGAVEQLLKQQGVDFSAAGGMSSLPVLNGMMGDRVKVLVDGVDITASCGNHMNPPLSYVSANQVQSFTVVAGISPEKTGMMPMNTEADNYSYRLKWRLNRDAQQALIFAHEYFDYHLDDWWPAIEGSMMMGPNDYHNINDGRRQRIAVFAEIEQNLRQ